LSVHPLNSALAAAWGTDGLPSLQPSPVHGRAGPTAAGGASRGPQPSWPIKAHSTGIIKSFAVWKKMKTAKRPQQKSSKRGKLTKKYAALMLIRERIFIVL